ncbi:SDR family oxidoreductase [Bacillus infantis]|uniref:SDR family oxidoreductase n=1 Tax=Bacillus infantis TaxID=324767 RepID=UPI000927E487|nr:short-chain type dehydrogenase/reductase [Mycobacteroides abscessus subsp. abscessus]
MDTKELFDLSNKTAIVTGGGRGLGEQMAYALAEAGANIVVCSRNLEACQTVSKKLASMGAQSLALECDVTNENNISFVIAETISHFGRLDILINNSGTSWVAPLLDYPEDKWDKVMDVNVKGAFLFTQAAARVMKDQGSGKIINIASVTGFRGAPSGFLDTPAYNTSKGALMVLTKDLAVKLAPYNIQVNSIAPGLFPTKMTASMEKTNKILLKKIPAGRFGKNEDLKGTALFLASSASDYVTGHTLVVDGGLTATI